jgi:DNA modification methylase
VAASTIKTAQAIEHWPIDRLVPYERNARTHSPEQVAQIAASIQEFGFTNPILVADDDGIIAGHGRLQAARELSMKTVPVVVLNHLNPEQRRAYVLADNKLALNAGWDDAVLVSELQALQSDDFDLSLLGWSDDELAELLADPEQLNAEELGDPDDVPEPPAEPITKPGDIWLLGKHRVMCGDSTAITDVERLMAGLEADMVFTDPPYNVAVCGGTHDPRDKKNFGKGPKIANDSMSDGDFKSFLLSAFSCIYAVTKPGAAVYVAHADSEGINFRSAYKESGFLLKQCLIWVKQQFVFGRSDYHWQHEPILYGWKDGASHTFYGERNQSTTWHIDRPMRSDKEHPTQKPVAIPQKAIENSSQPGQLLYEPFGGSGSTLIAAEAAGRVCYAMELSPAYVDVIIKRWQQFTGKTATLEATGERFPGDD